MKRLSIVAVVAAIFMCSDSAMAQQRAGRERAIQAQGGQQDRGQQRGREQRGGRGDRGGGGGGLFRVLDVDRDGILSAKEIDGAVAALMRLDVNKDGVLDAQELVVRGAGGRGGRDGRGREQSRENSRQPGGGEGEK